MTVDLVALESVVAVFDLGTVVDAARARGYSPAAISRHIGRLERRLGIQLFEPDGRSIRPTSDTVRLVDRARPLLAEVLTFETRGVAQPSRDEALQNRRHPLSPADA